MSLPDSKNLVTVERLSAVIGGTNGVWDKTKALVANKADKSSTVSNVAWSSNKLTKTINGTTTDVVTAATIKTAMSLTKSDVGLGNVDNTSDATKKTNFTGSIASENTGFVTGGAAYTALNGKQDTITFDGTYSASTNKAATVSTVTNAIAALDVSAIAGAASKTLTSISETDGKISATYSNIAIAESQVTNLTTDLAAKAPLASPALTGTPTAPTATAGTNTTQIATTAFVQTAVTNGLATADALTYKGTISGSTASASYGGLTVAANKGDVYKVTVAGKVDGVAVEVGDMIICNTDNTAAATSSNYATIAAKWDFIQTNLDGVVVGPASSTANAVAGFADASGKTITTLTAAQVKSAAGLDNVGNFKAVSTVASQGLTDTEKSNARTNIGAGTSNLTIGTTGTTAAAGNHTHTTSLATDTGTPTVTLETNKTYKLTAGGTSVILKTPVGTAYDAYCHIEDRESPNLHATMDGFDSDLFCYTPFRLCIDGMLWVSENITLSINGGSAVSLNTYGYSINPGVYWCCWDSDKFDLAPIGEPIPFMSVGRAMKLGYSTVGSSTAPVYLDSGEATACSAYAGGTAVTLNGTSKAASTASFYAPTAAGTSGQVLKSAGSGAPTWAAANAALVGITVTSSSVSDGTNTFNKYTHPTTSGNKHIPSGGSSGQFLGWDSNGTAKWVNNPNTDTVEPAKLGSGYGTCATAEATATKTATLSNYVLRTGGHVSVKFTYAVPASATLNINSAGAKDIYYRGAAITAGVIGAGDTATFVYDGTQYQLLSIDSGEAEMTSQEVTDLLAALT